MFPLILDVAARPVLLLGGGQMALRRLRQLYEAGAQVRLFAPEPEAELAEVAGEHLSRRWPEEAEMRGAVVFIAITERQQAEVLSQAARQAGALVNVEDMRDLCDFHVPALVRRGDLLFSISTGGRSPALARALAKDLSNRYGTEWEGRLEKLAAHRQQWKKEGASLAELAEKSRALIGEEKWLSH